MRQNIRSFTYATHALCSNCFHNGEPIFRFEKPISRCPKCNRQLKQNANAKKWKERNRELSAKINDKKLHRKEIVRKADQKYKRKLREKLNSDPVFKEQWLERQSAYKKNYRHKKGIHTKYYTKPKRESLSS